MRPPRLSSKDKVGKLPNNIFGPSLKKAYVSSTHITLPKLWEKLQPKHLASRKKNVNMQNHLCHRLQLEVTNGEPIKNNWGISPSGYDSIWIIIKKHGQMEISSQTPTHTNPYHVHSYRPSKCSWPASCDLTHSMKMHSLFPCTNGLLPMAYWTGK